MIASAMLVFALSLLTAAPSHAATFLVDSTTDAVDANPGDGFCSTSAGECTLRAAVQESNVNGQADSIDLDGSLGAFVLTLTGASEDAAATGDLDILEDVSINGVGESLPSLASAGATVDADGIDRVFDVRLPFGTVELNGLTVTGGAPPETQSGGGVQHTGATLNINSSVLTGNDVTGAGASGGGLLNNAGTANVVSSEISGNSAARAGGGVEALATESGSSFTSLTDTLLSDNVTGPTPGNGGGLHQTGAGTVTVDTSTVSGNEAASEGGGLWNSADGFMQVISTQILNNDAQGAAADNGGGGVFTEGGGTTVTDGRIAGNTASGAAGSGGGLMVVSGAGDTFGSFQVSGTRVANNTASRAGGGIEFRADDVFESVFLDEVTLFGNDTGPSPGNGGGLHITSTLPGTGTATIQDSAVTGNTAAQEGGGLWNDKGQMNVNNTVVNANEASGPLANDGGGGIFNNGGTLFVDNSTIAKNSATGTAGSGGGVFNLNGFTGIFSGTTIRDNDAQRAGGGIEALAGNTQFDSSSLELNSAGPAPGNGGGLHVTGSGTVDVNNSTVLGNTASEEGGGLWNSGTGTMNVSGSRINGNVADAAASAGATPDQGGGGLFTDGGDLNVQFSRINRNVAGGAAGSGGGILADNGATVTVFSVAELNRNSAVRAGGGIEMNNADAAGDLQITSSTLGFNSAGPSPGNGGAVHITGGGTTSVNLSSVVGNTATAEGGGLWNDTGTMTVSNTVVNGNTASGDGADQGGGGLFQNPGGSLTVSGVRVSRNDADGTSGSGGGILNDRGTLVVDLMTRVMGNTASRAGGGIEANVGDTTLDSVNLSNNSTGPNPGNGGGLHLTGAGTVDITGGRIRGNSADNEGGGVWNSAPGVMTLTGVSIGNNSAPTGPNAFHALPGGGTLTVNGTVVPPGPPGI